MNTRVLNFTKYCLRIHNGIWPISVCVLARNQSGKLGRLSVRSRRLRVGCSWVYVRWELRTHVAAWPTPRLIVVGTNLNERLLVTTLSRCYVRFKVQITARTITLEISYDARWALGPLGRPCFHFPKKIMHNHIMESDQSPSPSPHPPMLPWRGERQSTQFQEFLSRSFSSQNYFSV